MTLSDYVSKLLTKFHRSEAIWILFGQTQNAKALLRPFTVENSVAKATNKENNLNVCTIYDFLSHVCNLRKLTTEIRLHKACMTTAKTCMHTIFTLLAKTFLNNKEVNIVCIIFLV